MVNKPVNHRKVSTSPYLKALDEGGVLLCVWFRTEFLTIPL